MGGLWMGVFFSPPPPLPPPLTTTTTCHHHHLPPPPPPLATTTTRDQTTPFLMPIATTFSIPGRGTVVVGTVQQGVVAKGDQVRRGGGGMMDGWVGKGGNGLVRRKLDG